MGVLIRDRKSGIVRANQSVNSATEAKEVGKITCFFIHNYTVSASFTWLILKSYDIYGRIFFLPTGFSVIKLDKL